MLDFQHLRHISVTGLLATRHTRCIIRAHKGFWSVHIGVIRTSLPCLALQLPYLSCPADRNIGCAALVASSCPTRRDSYRVATDSIGGYEPTSPGHRRNPLLRCADSGT